MVARPEDSHSNGKDIVETLISRGNERGYLTTDEILDASRMTKRIWSRLRQRSRNF